MDHSEARSNFTETSEFPEVEEVDPRIQGELEKLNQSTDDINRWECELEDYRQRFRAVLVEATVKLEEQMRKIGRAVDDSKPYWEARRVARQAQLEAQKATQEFQRAVEILRAAKETIALAEERLLEEDSRQFDSAWQEMLNHATQRVMEAEQARTRCEVEHKKTAANYNSCIGHMKQLEKKLKRNINKSRPYFELKAKYYLQLEQLKRLVDERQTKLAAAKAEYRAALGNLETISERSTPSGGRSAPRRPGSAAWGSDGDGDGDGEGDNEDIVNFKMESDGLSMLSVSMDAEGGQSTSSEEETDPSLSSSSPRDAPSVASSTSPSSSSTSSSSSSSSSSHPRCPVPSAPLDLPCLYPSSSSSLYGPSPFLSSAPSSPSSPPCSCPSTLELPCAAEAHGPDSVCDSGRVSPVLGPRSQCSGASSPDCDCDQERGDRAEGAEATVEAGLNKLTLTAAAHVDEREDDKDSYPGNAAALIPTPATTPVLILNAV